MNSLTQRIEYNNPNPCNNCNNCSPSRNSNQQSNNNQSPTNKINLSNLPSIVSLEDLIANLRQVFEGDNVNIEYVEALMSSYKSNPHDWKAFAKFDPYRYTRNLVDEGNGKFNLMLICWGEGHGSAIHDHADAHCFMKILHGSLSEIRFTWPESNQDEDKSSSSSSSSSSEEPEAMKEISRNYLKTNSVCYMSDELGLHRVENPSHTEPAISLHLYSPPFSSCSMFDQRTGHRTKCQVTFWTKYGKKVNPNGKKKTNGADEDKDQVQAIPIRVPEDN